jgi:vacuolar-type H+-ATPase subunit H
MNAPDSLKQVIDSESKAESLITEAKEKVKLIVEQAKKDSLFNDREIMAEAKEKAQLRCNEIKKETEQSVFEIDKQIEKQVNELNSLAERNFVLALEYLKNLVLQ